MKRFEVKNINKSYENFTLKDLSFDLEEGYITGFIGPNGSGKTTTIKSILNFIKTDSGKILFNGNSIDDISYLKNIGIVTDSSFLPKDIKIGDVNKMMSIGYDNLDEKIFYDLLDKYKINESLKVEELSRGMSTKLMMCVALSHNATTLILDEPTSGLDPSAREEFRDTIQDFMEKDEKNTVLFSTHITTDLEKIADFILFIINGKKVFYGSKDDLLDEFRIIKGNDESFSAIEKQKLIGLRKHQTRSESLIRRIDLDKIKGDFVIENPSIDEIISFFNRG